MLSVDSPTVFRPTIVTPIDAAIFRADVWKSQPRHFCEFCKCWIADNKPSREFHEKGKRHQENVKRKISEVRKSATTKAQKEVEENSYMKEMELNARKAFLKDIERNPALAAEIKKRKEPPKKTEQKEGENESGSKKSESKEESGTWQVAFSPEGYPYYWNDITAEVTWVKPDGYVEETSEGDVEAPAKRADTRAEAASSGEEDTGGQDNTAVQDDAAIRDDAAARDDGEPVTKSEQEPPPPDVDDLSSIPLPTKDIPLPGSSEADPEKPEESAAVKKKEAQKRAHSAAYGSWEQVKEEEYVDLELPEQDSSVEQKVVVISEPKMKFKEKKIDSLGADLIAFKKRKQANRNLKQRNTDS